MISKIKSGKIANIKVLIGFILAASLVAVFACEQKQSVKAENNTAEKSVAIVFEGHTMQLSGDSVGIEKLKQFISKPIGSEKTTTLESQTTGDNKGDQVYMVVEQMPEFLGGEGEFRTFLARSVKYPAEAVKKGVQGKVYVSFVVGKDGYVTNAKVIRAVDPMLDVEALRVVNSMPKWTPGKQGGKDVAVQLTVPIYFRLQ